MAQAIPIHAVDAIQSDTADLKSPVVVYVGGDGDLKVDTEGGNTVTFVGMSAGDILPVSVVRIYSTGTTTTDMVMMW